MAQQTEFIPYKQAVELKELGFDEPTSFYWEDNVIRPLPMGDEVGAFHFNRHTRTKNEWICAPLYQQAFRWFRDVHGLNGVVEGSKKYGFEWCVFPDLDYYVKPPNNFTDYEEAEIACLRRLIDIVKDQKS